MSILFHETSYPHPNTCYYFLSTLLYKVSVLTWVYMTDQEFTAFKKGMSVGVYNGIKRALSIVQQTDDNKKAESELTELALFSINIVERGIENAGDAEVDTARA